MTRARGKAYYINQQGSIAIHNLPDYSSPTSSVHLDREKK